MKQITAIILAVLIIGSTLIMVGFIQNMLVMKVDIPFSDLQWHNNKPEYDGNKLIITMSDFPHGDNFCSDLKANITNINFQSILGIGMNFNVKYGDINRTIYINGREYELVANTEVSIIQYQPNNNHYFSGFFNTGWHISVIHNFTTDENMVSYMISMDAGIHGNVSWIYYSFIRNQHSNNIHVDDNGISKPFKYSSSKSILSLNNGLKPPMFSRWEKENKSVAVLSISPIYYILKNDTDSGANFVYIQNIVVIEINSIWVYVSILPNNIYWIMTWVYSGLIATTTVLVGYLILRKILDRNI